jgi:hypothetical protein
MATSETTLGPDPGAIARVAPPGAGGTLQDLVAHLARLGEPCGSSAAERQAWVQYPRGVLLRFPLDCTAPVEQEACSALLHERGVWLLNYLIAPDEGHPANCVHYVSRYGGYDIQKLDRQARQNVRRGLKTFELRLCTWEEWARKGFQAYAETEARHGYDADPRLFERMADRWRGCALYEIWGAWQGEDLAAWLTVLKVDDWAMVDLVRARTTALSGRPNNALLYLAGRHALVEERRRYVTLGTSSLQIGANEQSMHRYKVDMGYEAVPMRRVFVSRPTYRPILESRAMSWVWDRLSRTFPRSAPLRKVAGMARLLSGRGAPQVLEQPAQE